MPDNEDTVSVVILMDMLLVTSEKEHIYSYIDIVWGGKEAGKIILDFALPNDLTVINTFFRIKKSII